MRDGIDPGHFTLTLAYVVLSVVEISSGNVEEALRVVNDGIAAITAAGDDAFGRAALLSISSMWSVYVDPALARTYADEAVRLSRRVGNPTALSIALFAFGNVVQEDEPDRGSRPMTRASRSPSAAPQSPFFRLVDQLCAHLEPTR